MSTKEEILATARAILAGDSSDSDRLVKKLFQKREWYAKVSKKDWPKVLGILLSENPSYCWPSGTSIAVRGPDQGNLIFCKGDDTLWQGDNEAWIRSQYDLREFN